MSFYLPIADISGYFTEVLRYVKDPLSEPIVTTLLDSLDHAIQLVDSPHVIRMLA